MQGYKIRLLSIAQTGVKKNIEPSKTNLQGEGKGLGHCSFHAQCSRGYQRRGGREHCYIS
jgi:hypothetical protein